MAPKKRNRYSGSAESLAACLKPHANSPGVVFYGEDRKKIQTEQTIGVGSRSGTAILASTLLQSLFP